MWNIIESLKPAALAGDGTVYTGDEKTLGEFILHKRADLHLSLKKLSGMTGLNPAYIKDTESGYLRTMKKEELDKLASALDLNRKERHVMFDLSANGKIPEDIREFVSGNDEVQAFLRMIMDGYPAKRELGRRFVKALPKLPPEESEKMLKSMNRRKNG